MKPQNIASDYFEFGSYPQSLVTDEELISRLNERAGRLPTEDDPAGWTSFRFYIAGRNDIDFAWYIDVELLGVKYRAVYFVEYRCFRIDTIWEHCDKRYPRNGGCDLMTPRQIDNGFEKSTVYWFRFDPIRWRLLESAEDVLLLASECILDSMHFKRVEMDRHRNRVFFDNDYARSDLRVFMNETFLSAAFSDTEREAILPTLVDNSARSTMPEKAPKKWRNDQNPYVCPDTNDRVFPLSAQEVTDPRLGFKRDVKAEDPARKKLATEYARCLGIWYNLGDRGAEDFFRYTDAYYACKGFGVWWLRSPFPFDQYDAGKNFTVDSMGEVCSFLRCFDSCGGVVPALRVDRKYFKH